MQRAPAPSWDAPLTVGLLVFGLFEVTRAVAQARDIDATLDSTFSLMGLGSYSDAQAAEIGGILLIAVNVISLVLAIGFSVGRIRTRRRAAWIPVVCAVMSLVGTAAIVAGLLFADPSFVSHLRAPAS